MMLVRSGVSQQKAASALGVSQQSMSVYTKNVNDDIPGSLTEELLSEATDLLTARGVDIDVDKIVGQPMSTATSLLYRIPEDYGKS